MTYDDMPGANLADIEKPIEEKSLEMSVYTHEDKILIGLSRHTNSITLTKKQARKLALKLMKKI